MRYTWDRFLACAIDDPQRRPNQSGWDRTRAIIEVVPAKPLGQRVDRLERVVQILAEDQISLQKIVADLASETRKGFHRIERQFAETDRRMRETDERMRQTDERMRQTDERFRQADGRFR